jgi:pimeloyl-ACP methyl ester carboxylesterase
MGAIVTLLYASQGRDALPPRLVLLAPAWSGTSTLQTILQSLSIISAAPIANARAFLSGEWHPIPARMLFSEATTAYFDRLQNESVKALSDLIALQSNANFNVPEETPVFFFAGEVDSTVPYESVTALRDLVGHGELAVIPRATHDMMLSPHVWQQIADRIIVWLENSENQ